jgi:hypothetical protein
MDISSYGSTYQVVKKTKPTKPAATSRTTKDNSRVNTTSDDPLADLGLDDAPVTKTVTKPAPKVVEATVEATAPATNGHDTEASGRDEVEIGDIEFGFSEFIPTAKRKAEGSKYKFDDLVAPSVWTDGPNKGKPKIANFFVKLLPGVDADKLRRSVQSATTQANRQGADAGKYFVSRTATKNGEFIGMIVYRTDDKPTK